MIYLKKIYNKIIPCICMIYLKIYNKMYDIIPIYII